MHNLFVQYVLVCCDVVNGLKIFLLSGQLGVEKKQ